MTRTLEQQDRDERQNQHAQIFTPTNYPPAYQRTRLNKHKIPMRAYFPANYQVKRRKILFLSGPFLKMSHKNGHFLENIVLGHFWRCVGRFPAHHPLLKKKKKETFGCKGKELPIWLL